MTVFDDDVDMWEQAWADRLLQGEPVDGERGLCDLVSIVRASAEEPAPAPNAALAALLRDGLPAVDLPSQRRVPEQVRYWGSRTFRAGLAGVAASLAMGAGVATAAAGGSTGPLSYVPEPVKRGVDAAVTAVADVLRPEPEAPTPPQPARAPATSRSSGRADSDEPTRVKPPVAPAPAPAATTSDTVQPPETPAKPEPTTAPAPPAATPSLPPSALPTPPAEPSPEPEPSKSPEGEGRKPLDNGASPSPSPSPSPEPSDQNEQPNQPPAEGEPAEGEQAEGSAPGAGEPEPEPGEKKDKPDRAELTVERID